MLRANRLEGGHLAWSRTPGEPRTMSFVATGKNTAWLEEARYQLGLASLSEVIRFSFATLERCLEDYPEWVEDLLLEVQEEESGADTPEDSE